VRVPGVFVGINEDRLVSSLEEMAKPAVSLIEVDRVRAVDVPNDLRQIARGCRYEEMIVVVHQTVGMDDCFVSDSGCLQIGKKPFPVPFVPEYALSLIAAGGYIIEGPRIFYS
jgi:hypothetical protein